MRTLDVYKRIGRFRKLALGNSCDNHVFRFEQIGFVLVTSYQLNKPVDKSVSDTFVWLPYYLAEYVGTRYRNFSWRV